MLIRRIEHKNSHERKLKFLAVFAGCAFYRQPRNKRKSSYRRSTLREGSVWERNDSVCDLDHSAQIAIKLNQWGQSKLKLVVGTKNFNLLRPY